MSVARGVFALAQRDQVLKVNPLDGVDSLKLTTEEPDPFSRDEVDIVLAQIKKMHGADIHDYFEFAFFTGLRPSEQIELQWAKFDERARTVRIDQTRVRGKPKGETAFKTASVSKRGTKTHKNRDVPLNERALAVMMRQKARTMLRGDHVFINPATGEHWKDSNKQGDLWRAAMRLTRLRYRTQYDTRSTFATMLLMSGKWKPAAIARILGHSLQVFFQKYAKWIDDPTIEQRAMSDFDEFLKTGT